MTKVMQWKISWLFTKTIDLCNISHKTSSYFM